MSADPLRLLRSADPDSPDSVFRAAALAIRQGFATEALPLARRGTERHPHDARMWQVLGLAHRRLDDLAPAVAAFGKAVGLAPADPLLAHSLARTSLEAGLPAADLFGCALALAPADPGLRLGRIGALFADARLDDALAELDAWLAADPGWLDGHATAARLRWMRGDRAGFTASYRRALAAAPRDIAIWRGLLDTLLRAELFDEARADIAAARAAAGESPVFDALDAVCAAEQGWIEEADRKFAMIGPIAHVTMAARYMRHLLRAGRPAEASDFARPWQGRDPDHLLVPYLSAAWRLTGDPRWQWLEGDARLIGVYDLDIPDLDALAARLRALHFALHHPFDQSLRGGTQTDGPLFARIEPEIRALRAIIAAAVERHVARLPAPDPLHPTLPAKRAPVLFAGSWSVRLSGAGRHVNHVHPAGWISSAFYVALPDAAMGGPDQAGWLTLGEASELGLDLPPIRTVQPKPGRLVLFPSTMWHGTRPFAEGERLTVAFDVARPPQ